MKKLLLLTLLVLFGCSKEASEPEIPRYTLTVTANPPEGGLVNPQTGTYNSGQTVNIVASANDFFAFSNWTGNWNGTENSFTITMDSNKTITGNFEKIDLDEDGILNDRDNCPNTSIGSDVDGNGCSLGQKDSDNDGYTDDIDLCPGDGGDVDSNGCPDDDNDGVPNNLDSCPATYGWYDNQDSDFVTVDSNGCKINYVTLSPNDYTVKALENAEIGQLDVIWLATDPNLRTIDWTENNGFTSNVKPFNEAKFKIVDKDELRSILINGEDPGFYPVTSKITDMSNMFYGININTPYLKEVIKYMDVSNVTNMSQMFRFAYFKDLPVQQSINSWSSGFFTFWDTGNVENMSLMFAGARLNRLYLNYFDTSKVKTMRGMFSGYHSYDISNYPIQPGQSITSEEIRPCPYTGVIIEPDGAGGGNKFIGTCMTRMSSWPEWVQIVIDSWDVSSVEDFAYMFENYGWIYSNIEEWNTSSATDMTRMFWHGRHYGNFQDWNVSNVTNCINFNKYAEIDKGYIDYNGASFKIYYNTENIQVPLAYRSSAAPETLILEDYHNTRLPNFTNCTPD